jgi:hypothetical protein
MLGLEGFPNAAEDEGKGKGMGKGRGKGLKRN